MSDSMRYFPEEDIIHIMIKKGDEARSIEISPNVTVELDENGEMIGIEILNATRTTERGVRADGKRSEADMTVKSILLLYLYSRSDCMLALRLPKELEDRLEKLAAATHRTKSFYARQAIERYLEDIEDLYLAEKAYRDYLEGKSKTKSIEDIVRENEL
jgi:RHH-type rel operon transcriptional repressor/antitoxin RelB